MPGSFQEVYLRLDRRVLGSFRILLGLVLLYDVARRFPDAALLWSSDGVLSVESLLRAPQDTPQTSLLLGVSSAGAIQAAFAAMACVFGLYTLGLYTRVMQVLALVCYTSLNARNLFFEDGGTSVVIILLTWTSFVPLGDWFSLDALRREARLPRLLDRVRLRRERREPLVSLLALIMLLQAAAIYWLNAAHKSGHTWRVGDAVHLVLWQHRVNTPIAIWFSAHEPAWFSPLATWLTVRSEYLMPILLLWPSHPSLTRPVAFVMALLLHGGIALVMTLGPFSYAMICLVWLTLPGTALAALGRRVPRRAGLRLALLRARLLRAWRKRGGLGPPPGQARPAPGWWPRAREAALGVMLLVELVNLLNYNRAIPQPVRTSRQAWRYTYKPYLRGFQGWSMFAPNAPESDGTLVIDAVTRSGRHVDPFTGATPDFEQVRRGAVPHRIAVSDYLLSIRDAKNKRYRHDLRRYLRRYGSAADPIVSAEVWWVSYTPPKRGAYQPGPLHKEQLWKIKT